MPELADERAIAHTVVNRIAAARGLTPPWPEPGIQLPDWLETAGVADWGVIELGEMRQRLLAARQRDAHGVVYTPREVVDFQIRSALQLAGLDQLDGHPRPLEHITIHDPFTGCGIYMIHAARYVAAWCLRQVDAPPDVPDWARSAVTAQVLEQCIYGQDLDEVAVDIAKSVCWLEVDGIRPISFMDRNVIVGDTFAGDLPPGLAERWPAESRGPDSAPVGLYPAGEVVSHV